MTQIFTRKLIVTTAMAAAMVSAMPHAANARDGHATIDANGRLVIAENNDLIGNKTGSNGNNDNRARNSGNAVTPTSNRAAVGQDTRSGIGANTPVNATTATVTTTTSGGVESTSSSYSAETVEVPATKNTTAATTESDLNAITPAAGEVKTYERTATTTTTTAVENAGLTIDQLPKEGNVSIQGEVASVEGDKKFVLRDAKGNTIDVKADEDLMVNQGAKVSVVGEVDKPFFSTQRRIEADSVTVLN